MNKDVDLIWEAYNTVNEGFFSDIKSAFKEGQMESAYENAPRQFIDALEPFADDMASEEFIKMLKSGEFNEGKQLQIVRMLEPVFNRAVKEYGGIMGFVKHLSDAKHSSEMRI